MNTSELIWTVMGNAILFCISIVVGVLLISGVAPGSGSGRLGGPYWFWKRALIVLVYLVVWHLIIYGFHIGPHEFELQLSPDVGGGGNPWSAGGE
jgi:hypothetical protein